MTIMSDLCQKLRSVFGSWWRAEHMGRIIMRSIIIIISREPELLLPLHSCPLCIRQSVWLQSGSSRKTISIWFMGTKVSCTITLCMKRLLTPMKDTEINIFKFTDLFLLVILLKKTTYLPEWQQLCFTEKRSLETDALILFFCIWEASWEV